MENEHKLSLLVVKEDDPDGGHFCTIVCLNIFVSAYGRTLKEAGDNLICSFIEQLGNALLQDRIDVITQAPDKYWKRFESARDITEEFMKHVTKDLPLTYQVGTVKETGGWVCSRMAQKSSSVRPSKTPDATEGCFTSSSFDPF